MRLPEHPTTADIDARSEELFQEYERHNEQVTSDLRAKHPELIEPDEALHRVKLFTGWATQKISSLQLLIEWQQAAIFELLAQQKQRSK